MLAKPVLEAGSIRLGWVGGMGLCSSRRVIFFLAHKGVVWESGSLEFNQ